MRRLHFNSSLLLAAWACSAAWAIGSAADVLGDYPASNDDAMPLLSYRRSDDTRDGADSVGSNPLRPPNQPATAVTPAQVAMEEMTPGEPQYAMPAAAMDANGPAEDPSDAVESSAELPPAPAAPLDDYDAAPLADYKAPGASRGSNPIVREPRVASASLPTTSAAANQSPTSFPAANSIPLTPPISAAEDATDRRLAPPSARRTSTSGGQRSSAASFLSGGLGQFKGLASAGAGLAVVIALFLLFSWTMRRGGPKSSSVLPESAFAVLGRAPLTAQSFAQLLRVGNKLVLVAMSADGAQPLTEVTDPLEVDRIAGLCMSGKPNGSSAEFQQVLAQLSKEPARGFLGREASQARRRA
jgi:flagellar biogenesis protein FliO